MMADVSMDPDPATLARLDELLAEIGVERIDDDRVSLPISTFRALMAIAGRNNNKLRDMKPKGHC